MRIPVIPGRWRLRLGLLAALVLLGALGMAGWCVQAAAQAWVFGYPLVITDITREAFVRTVGPENRLAAARKFPDAAFRSVVKPNVDTLYTTAFIDMAQGPWVFEMPANAARYEVMPFMDAWTNVFAAPGTRVSGTQGGRFLLAGPGWKEPVPAGMTLLVAPTRIVWLIGRTQTNGEADYPLVHQLQDGLRLNRLEDWRAGRETPAPAWQAGAAGVPPVEQLRALGMRGFSERLARLMADNPPTAQDQPMVERLARLGIRPGQPVSWSAPQAWLMERGRHLAGWMIQRQLERQRSERIGWNLPPASLGAYGTDYGTRAGVALVGLGANLPADAAYPGTTTDAQGRPLDGRHRYRIRFDAGALPPVQAFWSVTAYGEDDFLLDTPARRHALSSREPLVRNADGSVDLLIQAEPVQGPLAANWLPVRGDGRFTLVARLYWPRAEALDGRWVMPGVQRLD